MRHSASSKISFYLQNVNNVDTLCLVSTSAKGEISPSSSWMIEVCSLVVHSGSALSSRLHIGGTQPALFKLVRAKQ